MEKRISFFNFQSVKAVAKAIDPHLRTIETLKKRGVALKEEYDEKLAKLQKEFEGKVEKVKQDFDACKTQIDALEAGILQVTGYYVADLVQKVIEPTGKEDPKTGKPIKVTKYIPTSIVTYDEQTKEYVITSPDTEAPAGDNPAGEEEGPYENSAQEEPAEEESPLPFEMPDSSEEPNY